MRFILFLVWFLIPLESIGSETVFSEAILASMKSQLSQTFAEARIILEKKPQCDGQTDTFFSATLMGTDARGVARFVLQSEHQKAQQCSVSFEAWAPVRIALKRVPPGESLSESLFETRQMDLSRGSIYNYRGILLSKKNRLAMLQSIQTIVEGQFLLSSSVQYIPDIRKGDPVTIKYIGRGISVRFSGLAQESGYQKHAMRVLSKQTKREFVGLVMPDGTVEVRL